MINRHLRTLAATATLALAAGAPLSSQAHHSFAAEFDANKPVTVDGVVTKAQFTNPHSWLYLDVKNKDGSTTNWGFEFGTPASLRNIGLAKEDVAPGAQVHVEGYRARNGGAFGYSTVLTLEHGRKLQTGAAPARAAAAAAP